MKELTWDAAEKILARNHLGRLACYSPSRDTSYIVPMSYAFHDGSIYLGMLPGQKLNFLREHPQGVCFEVDEITNDSTWITVIATGVFVELQGPERSQQEAAAIERALHGPLRAIFYENSKRIGAAGLHIGALRISALTARQDSWSWETDFPESLRRLDILASDGGDPG
jgi:nitroimidazol reductase NimA-like FMN-containing flavoprotein (pyridoxamine 5'-phosphate oxidase superfamily)